jgi:hypothetical protein
VFLDAPAQLNDMQEQNLEFYSLFQQYLKLYEDTLSSYINSLDVSDVEFYQQLAAVKDDPAIKDKKLLHFVNYLLASTDYPNFYKLMTRAAKKINATKVNVESSIAESKQESKADDDDAKADHKGSTNRIDHKASCK